MRNYRNGKTTTPSKNPPKRGGWQACLECLEKKVEKPNGCAHSSATMAPVDDSEARPDCIGRTHKSERETRARMVEPRGCTEYGV